MRVLIRVHFVLWLMIIIMLAAAIIIGTLLTPLRVGTLRLLAYHEGEFRTYFIDHDTGVVSYQAMPQHLQIDNGLLVNPDEPVLSLEILSAGIQNSIRRSYIGLHLHDNGLFWIEPGRKLLLIANRSVPAQTILFHVDIQADSWTEWARFEGLNAGFFNMSPNGRYLVLRETQANVRILGSPRPMLLLDLQTGETFDLHSPNLAYWSPDGLKLLLGYPFDASFSSQIRVYDVSTKTMLAYDISVPLQDTPFFDNLERMPNAGAVGLLWRPDSQAFAASDSRQNALYYGNLDGALIRSTVGRIIPNQWSPNQRYLLGFGSDTAGRTGLFIINPLNGEQHILQSPILLLQSTAIAAWSANSRYVGVTPRPTHEPGYAVAVFNLRGEMVGTPFYLQFTEDQSFILRNGLGWYSNN